MWDILEKYTVAPSVETDEQYLALDEVQFHARFQDCICHSLAVDVYRAMQAREPVDEQKIHEAEHLCELWCRRGLSEEDDNFRYAQQILALAKDSAAGKAIDMSAYAAPAVDEADKEIMLRVIHERRSVRAFSDREVPDELLEKILEAGLYAAHSSNLQSIRYLVIREKNEPWLFRGSDIPPGPVHIAILQDERCYLTNHEKALINRVMDAGAATTNILLAIHAHGLDGVWLTYIPENMERLRKRFNLPDYIRIVDFIDLGYGIQTPYPPQRPSVEERVIVRV